MLYFRCIASSGHVRYMSYSDSMLNVILLPGLTNEINVAARYTSWCA